MWDEPKRLRNIDKQGLDFALLDEGFFDDAALFAGHSGRTIHVGRIGGLLLVAVARPLGTEAISVVSLRPAGTRERRMIDDEEE